MGAYNPYDNFPELHRGRSFSKDFERIDTLKMGDKILVEDARTGRVMYCYVNQLKAIDPEFGEYLKTASISEDGSTLTLTKSDGTQIVFHGGAGAVRFDTAQVLTEGQKGVARGNIGAISTSEMAAAILAESQRAQDTEERLRGNIQAETERAMQTEAELSNNILAEQTRAENAESALSARIDTIVQGRNVRDIVGNYDELLAYDTSTLGDNDIVMVLLDATKSGHTTYYRWKQAESEWEFIGGLAFTYTKTEIDDKFRALHIVLPSIPADAVEHPEEYQELLAQVDTMVRGAGSDASFKMPVRVVDGITGNVDVTFVKSNPAHLFLGIFADDMSTLYHIIRTTSTPRTYTLQIVEKVFVTKNQAIALANDAITDALDEENQGAIIEAIKAHHDTTKQNTLIPGSGITIENNIISATGGGESGKRGVISQTQTWYRDYSGYTMSNLVWGTIPQANIDLVLSYPNVFFNDTDEPIERVTAWGEKVSHLPGYFYLNGLGDLSYEEMLLLYHYDTSENIIRYRGRVVRPYDGSKNVRTFLTEYTGLELEFMYSTSITSTTAFYHAFMEVLWIAGNRDLDLRNVGWSFIGARPQTKVVGYFNLQNLATNSDFFNHATNIHTIWGRLLTNGINLSALKYLRLPSIYQLISTANTNNQQSITLHPDAYARVYVNGDASQGFTPEAIALGIDTALSTHADVSLAK